MHMSLLNQYRQQVYGRNKWVILVIIKWLIKEDKKKKKKRVQGHNCHQPKVQGVYVHLGLSFTMAI